jgi:hypothetical protein
LCFWNSICDNIWWGIFIFSRYFISHIAFGEVCSCVSEINSPFGIYDCCSVACICVSVDGDIIPNIRFSNFRIQSISPNSSFPIFLVLFVFVPFPLIPLLTIFN